MTACMCNACALHGFGCCSRASMTAIKLTPVGREQRPMCNVCAHWWAPVAARYATLAEWMNAPVAP